MAQIRVDTVITWRCGTCGWTSRPFRHAETLSSDIGVISHAVFGNGHESGHIFGWVSATLVGVDV